MILLKNCACQLRYARHYIAGESIRYTHWEVKAKAFVSNQVSFRAFPCRLPWNFLVNFINERVGFGPSVSRFLSEDRHDKVIGMQAESQLLNS